MIKKERFGDYCCVILSDDLRKEGSHGILLKQMYKFYWEKRVLPSLLIGLLILSFSLFLSHRMKMNQHFSIDFKCEWFYSFAFYLY